MIDLLADLLGKRPAELRSNLLSGGPNMPVDSLDLFDVLVEFRQQTDITLPKRKLSRSVMRSVSAFAAFAAHEGQA